MTIMQDIVAAVGWQTRVNENFRSVGPAGLYGINPVSTTGLTLGYLGGPFNGITVADGTVSLTASATNYVVAHRTTGAVTAATNQTNWLDTTTYMQLYQLVAGATTFTIATTSDRRQAFGGSGGAGSTFLGGTLTSALNEAPQVTIASSTAPSATAIGAAAANTVIISGTTTITGFDTIAAGAIRRLRFSGALILTHNATSLILPGTANITTAAGDVAVMESLGSGNWRCIGYAKADGTPVVGSGGGTGTVTSVDASGGVETASGAAITVTGTVRGATLVNAQTGTTYTYVTGDRGKLVTHSNAASIAGTLPQATSTFGAGWFMSVKNKGAGTLTITPTTSTIDGASTLALATGQWAVIVSDGTNYQATIYAPGAGASLSFFTESQGTTTPNDAIYASRMLATGSTTSVDAVLAPKSAGAVQGQSADGTTTGGNKRGSNATDWQRSRTAAAQVASSASATISGGANNTASSTGATVAGGRTNTASGTDAFSSGNTNTSSGANSVTLGNDNTATNSASISIGAENTSSGQGSVAIGRSGLANADYARTGGYFASARAVVGADAYASANFSVAGDAQRRALVIRRSTTDATASAVTSTNAAASATNQLNLPSNSAMSFRGDVVAWKNATGDCAMWSVVGLAKNVAGTFSIVGTPTVTLLFNDAGASTWVLAITADNTNKAVTATVTGVAATNIKWVGSLQSVEVVG